MVAQQSRPACLQVQGRVLGAEGLDVLLGDTAHRESGHQRLGQKRHIVEK